MPHLSYSFMHSREIVGIQSKLDTKLNFKNIHYEELVVKVLCKCSSLTYCVKIIVSVR